MIMILLIGLLLIGFAVALGLRAYLGDAARGQETMQHIGSYGFAPRRMALPLGRRERLNRSAETLGALYSRYAGTAREQAVLELLHSAGLYRMRAVTFFGYRVLATLVTAVFWLWMLSISGAQPVAVFLLVV